MDAHTCTGFENYVPRSLLKGDKVPKASANKAETPSSGGSGGNKNNDKKGETGIMQTSEKSFSGRWMAAGQAQLGSQ